FGRLKDPAYVQRSLSNHDDVIAQFQDFQIVHFRNDRPRSSKYGRSLLKSARRLWRQLQLMEDGMVVARLDRAPMRYVFQVPGGDLDLDSQVRLIEKYRDMYKKKKVIDPATGKPTYERNVMTADEDLFVPVSKDYPADVRVLQGQGNLHDIGDVQYFQNKLFSRLEIPKALMGEERDVTGRLLLTNQDMHLVRKVSRRRAVLAAGYREICDLQLALLGIDPLKAEYTLKFVPLITDDELNRSNIEKSQ